MTSFDVTAVFCSFFDLVFSMDRVVAIHSALSSVIIVELIFSLLHHFKTSLIQSVQFYPTAVTK